MATVMGSYFDKRGWMRSILCSNALRVFFGKEFHNAYVDAVAIVLEYPFLGCTMAKKCNTM